MLSTRRLMWALYLVISVAAVRLDTGKQVDVNGDSLLIKAVHESERKLPSLPAEWRDRFEIEKELAEGGDGVVYKLHVLCGSGDSFVSAKLVTAKKRVAKAAERMRLMKDEEYVISSIGVPDSVDTTDGRWIMMPFMNSGSFSALFRVCRDSDACMCQTKEHPSPCWETIREHDLLWVLALFYQAVEGVSAIHAKGYVHMDLKLDNIMLQCKGTSCFASIIDLDQMCGPGEGDCEGGTVGFAAPEVHEGHQGLPANDVWSMGTVLYILLYGEWPPYMEFFWNPDSARKQAAYKPEEDATIPKKRRSIDNLVVEMLNTNYETRISLEEVKKGVKDFITAEQPDQEVLDMLYKTPTARGLTDDLPTCISDYTPSSFDPKHCRNTPTRAEGWFTCGICVLCDPCCECWTLYNGRIKTEYFFAKSCE